MSTERRTLLAVVLAMAVMAIWFWKFPPQKPQPPPAPPAQTQPVPQPQAPAAAQARGAQAIPTESPVVRAAQERFIVVENGLYRVTFSNRGAIVRSWKLKKFKDDRKPPQTLDLVHAESSSATGNWPLSLLLTDPDLATLQTTLNSDFYESSAAQDILRAPAAISFEWSDGSTRVRKSFRFDESYLVRVETSVTSAGKPVPHALAWRGGFGDLTGYRAAQFVKVFYSLAGKVQYLEPKNLGVEGNQLQPQRLESTVSYGGIEDRYFAAAFLAPENQQGDFHLWHWKRDTEVLLDGKPVKVEVPGVAATGITPGETDLRLFVGPKSLEELGEIRPPLTNLVDFGWFSPIAKPLFFMLKWIHNYVPNYGWAIVLMTLAINMVLFPLKIISFRSMRKMQTVAPQVKQIQDKYKKYPVRDPRRQQMQQEIMDLYKRNNIDPTGGCVGGCLPMVLQMPIWFALYQMLNATIELRHAPWLGWIHDLSAPDPYYILPIIMAVTFYLTQKLTPTPASMDPAQQKMMKFMPIMFGGMFIVFPVSSGLVLYILTSNLVGVGQQVYLNKTHPQEKTGGFGKGKKKNQQ